MRELRLVVTAPITTRRCASTATSSDCAEREAYASAGGRVVILDAGRATLELTDPSHAAYIDDVEVGRRVAGPHPRRASRSTTRRP